MIAVLRLKTASATPLPRPGGVVAMGRRYGHLSHEERGMIFAERRRGASLRAIGGLLGRAASTISRELGRGEGEDGCYSPQVARAVYEVRRGRCKRPRKLIEGSGLHDWVRDRLVHFRWSPEQIAGRLKAMEPDDPGSRVSHETIYAAIYTHPRGGRSGCSGSARLAQWPSLALSPPQGRVLHRYRFVFETVLRAFLHFLKCLQGVAASSFKVWVSRFRKSLP